MQKFALADGRRFAFYWTPRHHRTHVVWEAGAIGGRFTAAGGTARYGFPDTDEVSHPDGSVTVSFTKGAVVRWTAEGGVQRIR
ncbi:hypothetical protein E4U03_07055 [Rothia nasimurium]|uniref:Uncharacterized protein n=2 Tax=Rothia nasimurium TaxID=85336 RepID=A0A4Y9F2Z0_9MICC|nr:hypothetical protein [Rothia nasimurium]TFU22182.1 hypothetical protein E4U03_07055 [Rothia nasimurium]